MKRTYIIVAIGFLLTYCSSYDGAPSNTETGTGGSLARFTISGNTLYTVDSEKLHIIDISNDNSIMEVKNLRLSVEAETIFPKDTLLFLGTRNGMLIFDINEKTSPKLLKLYEHIYACDPVVADDKYAYITLNSIESSCRFGSNELQIINIEDPKNPRFISSFSMQSPKGLAIKNDTLYICDNGLKIFDVSNKMDIKQLYHFQSATASDIILNDDIAIMISNNALKQYKIEEGNINLLSEIEFHPDY